MITISYRLIIILISVTMVWSCTWYRGHPPDWLIDYHGGRYDQAEKSLNRHIEKLPNYWACYHGMGLVKFKKNEYR